MSKKYYFYGKQVSDYGVQNGRVDYRTLASTFDAILNNDIMQKTYDIGYWEQENGFIDNQEEIEEKKEQLEELQEELEELEELGELDSRIEELKQDIEELETDIEQLEYEEESQYEVFQYYIIDDNGARILKEWTNEIVYYNEELDMYLWGVCHWGTSWDYVLTDIPLSECASYEE